MSTLNALTVAVEVASRKRDEARRLLQDAQGRSRPRKTSSTSCRATLGKQKGAGECVRMPQCSPR